MRLSAVRIHRTLNQFEDHSSLLDAQPIPQNSPAMGQLNDLFGDHTFFIDRDGLHIIEPAESTASEPTGKVVKLAAWKDSAHQALTPQPPEATGIVVVLGADEAEEEEPSEEDSGDERA